MATTLNDINLSECTLSFASKSSSDYPESIQYLTGVMAHSTLRVGDIASVRCVQISLSGRMGFKSHGGFFSAMDGESAHLSEFCLGLFDDYGNVRSWHVDGGARSGSGCWGNELSDGSILFIEDLTVKKEFRSCGVDSLMLQKLLISEFLGYRGLTFASPPSIASSHATNKAEWDQAKTEIIAFLRKNGFRRIGLTQFLAYSPDPSHPSHALPASSDPNPHFFEQDGPDLTMEAAQTLYPVHHAIITDEGKTHSIIDFIRTAYHISHTSLRQRDQHGFLPIHIAAQQVDPYAVYALLDVCSESGIRTVLEDLNDRENAYGVTPLEALDASMTATKELAKGIFGDWAGHCDAALGCDYMLRKAAGLPLPGGEVQAGEYFERRRFGCTCGACAHGWLSPRMRFRLSTQAALTEDMQRVDAYAFTSRRPLPASALHAGSIDYIPGPIKHEIYKTFYTGYHTLFYAIYLILDFPGDSNRLPLPQEVLTTALGLDARAVRFYLAKGGLVEYAIDATVNTAREQSSLVDGEFELTFDNPEYEVSVGEGEVRYRDLPKCANDLDFDLVRMKLGLSLRRRWGPYY